MGLHADIENAVSEESKGLVPPIPVRLVLRNGVERDAFGVGAVGWGVEGDARSEGGEQRRCISCNGGTEGGNVSPLQSASAPSPNAPSARSNRCPFVRRAHRPKALAANRHDRAQCSSLAGGSPGMEAPPHQACSASAKLPHGEGKLVGACNPIQGAAKGRMQPHPGAAKGRMQPHPGGG